MLVEALACGCPVVSMNCHTGATEILRPGGKVGVGTLDFRRRRCGVGGCHRRHIGQSAPAQTAGGEGHVVQRRASREVL